MEWIWPIFISVSLSFGKLMMIAWPDDSNLFSDLFNQSRVIQSYSIVLGVCYSVLNGIVMLYFFVFLLSLPVYN